MANHRPFVRVSCRYGIAGFLLLASASVFASGFALIEQSVSGMGTAYANGSAGIDDASTIFFNPAGMARLSGSHTALGVQVVVSDVDFSGTASYNPNNPLIAGAGLGGMPVPGKRHTDVDLIVPVPAGYISHQYNDRLWFGLGIFTPFGLETDYDKDDWVGRYHATKSELITININPSMAFRIDEHASVGIGVSAMYADATLKNAVDFALLDQLGLIPGGPVFGGAPPGTQAFDGEAKFDGDDWGFGFNIGVLLEPTPATRLGLHYRSKVKLELEGDLKITGPLPTVRDNDSADVNLPDSVSLSAYHELTSKWAFMADLTWTQWSKLDALVVEFDTRPDNITPLDWDDTVRVAVGASYRHNDKWLYRGGLAYDESPVPSDDLRTPRVPDADRYWLTLGARYQHSRDLSFDFGYAHLFVDDPDINSADAHSPPLSTGFHLLDGEYDAAVDIVSAQVNWKFN